MSLRKGQAGRVQGFVLYGSRRGSGVRSRSGFTLIEVLVVLGVLSILVSLLAVAVVASRAEARRVQCMHRLKEIGVAAHNHESVKGAFPLDEMSGGLFLAEMIGSPVDASPLLTVQSSSLVKCPADPLSDWKSVSFLINTGTTMIGDNGAGTASSRGRRAADITDGLSSTAMYGERLIAVIGVEFFEQSYPERLPRWTTRKFPATTGAEDAFLEECARTPLLVSPQPQYRLPFDMGYDHIATPNHHACWNGPADQYVQSTGPGDNLSPASSLHSGGVNALFMDGHGRFVSNHIDLAVWRAIGTIAGAESVEIE